MINIDPKIIEEWQELFPWFDLYQVEQDLMLSIAIVLIFRDEYLASRLVMLGGTAIYKLNFKKTVRYSEDIDLALAKSVSRDEIHKTLSRIRKVLGPSLGKAKVRFSNRTTIIFRIKSIFSHPANMRLKLDIDTIENFSVLDYIRIPFDVQSGCFSGSSEVGVYQLEEYIAKKLRALGEPNRVKGRDLFDMWYAKKYGGMNDNHMLKCFFEYMKMCGKDFSKEHYEKILKKRMSDPAFRVDTERLIDNVPDWDIDEAGIDIKESIISRLPSKYD